jgi:hypothetical protein
MSLFPKVIKTESNWPFPTSLRLKKLNEQLPQRYNPSNDEESPI